MPARGGESPPLGQRDRSVGALEVLEHVLRDDLLVAAAGELGQRADVADEVGLVEGVEVDVEVALALVVAAAEVEAWRVGEWIEGGLRVADTLHDRVAQAHRHAPPPALRDAAGELRQRGRRHASILERARARKVLRDAGTGRARLARRVDGGRAGRGGGSAAPVA